MVAADYLLAVDLGTTFTAAAVLEPGEEPRVFALGGSSALSAPSAVARVGDDLTFGKAAIRRAGTEPEAVATEFKRRMGDETPVLLSGTPYGAEALTGALLGWVIGRVSEEMGSPPTTLALAHPANWGPHKLGLLREASRLAGFPEPVFVSEPVAAASHYASSARMDVGERVAVYDLGGGTFDTAVVERTEEGFEILGTPQGMDRFGGIDLDFAVLSHVRRTVGGALSAADPSEPASRSALQRLRDDVRIGKEALSDDPEATIPVALPGLHTQVRITREEFEDAVRPRIRDTLDALRNAISSAGLDVEDVSRVLLVGGASRVPLVADTIRSGLGRPVALDANPKNAICLGAARAAAAPRSPTWAPAVADRASRFGSTRRRVAAAAIAATVLIGGAAAAFTALNPSEDPPPAAAAATTTTTTLTETTSTADPGTQASEPAPNPSTTRPSTPTTSTPLTTTTAGPSTTTTTAPKAPARTTTTTTTTTTTVPPVPDGYSEVPSVKWLEPAAATTLLDSLSLGWILEEGCYSVPVDEGLVAWQSPEPGIAIPKNGSFPDVVTMGVQSCSEEVPNVVGLETNAATDLLDSLDLGWSLDVDCYEGSAQNGYIVYQSPDPGYVMLKGGGSDKTVFLGVQQCP